MADEAVNQLEYISRKLRESIVATLPCASEQYVTISMPGTMIDTSPSSQYIIKGEENAGRRNALNVAEARLVDSMIPVDKVMLGPTGKSVTRSYLASLDYLVPGITDMGIFSKNENTERKMKYKEAIAYLRTKSDKSEKANKNQEGSNSQQTDFDGTVVAKYVQKQMAWAKARGEWDAIRLEAEEDLALRGDGQTAAKTKKRNMLMKKTQAELHARWMDWVVNGDKLYVDHNFAIVDQSDIMVRIEQAKEATRDMLITDVRDGTDWARVYLEPVDWALRCRKRAEDWAKRNPVNLEMLKLQLRQLEAKQQDYEGYQKWAADSAGDSAIDDKSTDFEDFKSSDFVAKKAQVEEAQEAVSKVEIVATELEAKAVTNDFLQATKDTQVKAAKDELKEKQQVLTTAKSEMALIEAKSPRGGVKLCLVELHAKERALREVNDLKADDKDKSGKLTKAKEDLETAKENWFKATARLQQYENQMAVKAGRKARFGEMKDAVTSDITSLKKEISNLRAQLKNAKDQETSTATRDAIVGVDKDSGELLRAQPVPRDTASTSPMQETDAWTKITFTASMDKQSTDASSSSLQADFRMKFGGILASAEASTSVSKEHQELKKKMSKCSVSGSFSAMLVTIKRPWLHGELFADYEVDTSVKLSPGARELKKWMDSPSNHRALLAEYNQFPSYPTAFIVAADTQLDIQTTDSEAEEMMDALSTDSSLSVSYGPWSLSAGAHVKTDNKNSSQRMQIKSGGLSISFQAPQVIGWVSEILPQLPRVPGGAGGLVGPPNAMFRARL